jgi:hypothetical protein
MAGLGLDDGDGVAGLSFVAAMDAGEIDGVAIGELGTDSGFG